MKSSFFLKRQSSKKVKIRLD